MTHKPSTPKSAPVKAVSGGGLAGSITAIVVALVSAFDGDPATKVDAAVLGAGIAGLVTAVLVWVYGDRVRRPANAPPPKPRGEAKK